MRYLKTNFVKLLILGGILSGLNACVSVKAYQRQYLNDSEMELSARKIEKFEQNAQLYREGASGANGGKSGGGCGCN